MNSKEYTLPNGKKAVFEYDACGIGKVTLECMDELMAMIADRPQGEWIRTFDGNEWYWYCSNCKEQWYEEDLWMGGNEFPHFCPNCGAEMREREGE